ncbi:CAAX protease [Stenomitos frigidus]|uniref:CAAX protease n=1 Tax=Stenomitos frigidus ULC18 TaxID=2107698 RepID=A0A2T1DT44_9CYAN|nr:CAAX protease [Stenomitos frigidus]PSB23645.1 CAAX protease [Stenomitos frigidus ULC18]
MTATGATPFWDLLGGVFRLHLEAFQQIANLPGVWSSLLVVLFAGLSLGVGQSIILFINRVKPVRFVLSLLLNAILFTVGFLFLVLSTWLICRVPWSVKVPFTTLIKVLGFSYAPQLFSFLGALPYAGLPVLNLLSVWRLLAAVVGFAAAAQVTGATAFSYVAFGWLALQLLENSIGQPIAKLGQAIADRVAGVNLVEKQSELADRVQAGRGVASPMLAATQTTVPEMNQLVQAAGRSAPETAQAVAPAVVSNKESTTITITQRTDVADPLVQLDHKPSGLPQQLKLLLSLLAMAIVFMAIALLLRPIRESLFGWHNNLPKLFRLILDLVWIGVIAVVFAGMLAPLETLGWWAGWYGDDVDTSQTAVNVAKASPSDASISRYVVYLDGVGQSGETYTPDVMAFLNALKPALPQDVELVQGLMMYSVMNRPLGEDRPLAFVWRLADKMRWSNPTDILGFMLNLRNVFIVAVSADKRYGPIYNQGIAQVLYDGLTKRGYQPGSGIPITLIGYSGGGQMSVAAAPYLKRATGAPIEIISLGGVMSANNNFLKLEHLYHVAGNKDGIERIGPAIFPGRRQWFPLSYWNRAMRRGKITLLSIAGVGHQVPGGYMDPQATLPDGRTYLQATIELILQILRGEVLTIAQTLPRKTSNYALYQQAAFIHADYYPLHQSVDETLYQPIHPWMGRLILPQKEERAQVKGVLFEVHHAPAPYQQWVGKVVALRWANDPIVKKLVAAVTRDVHFSVDAEYSSVYGGCVNPDRLNHWRQVDPLESLAGCHPVDDVMVLLNDPVDVEPMERSQGNEKQPSLYIRSLPVEITGRYYAVVQFVAPVSLDQFRVVHFNRISRQFDGVQDVVSLPQVVLADAYGSYPSTTRDLEKSPLNEAGWYIYGAKNAAGMFVVQSLAPRALWRLQPQEVVFGSKAGYRYIRKRAWAEVEAQKGQIASVLCTPRSNGSADAIQTAINAWQEGDRALLIHTYGGIGGMKKEPAAATPIFFGHFAYGLAEVVREALTDDLRFEIRYFQVYAQNTDGLTAGTLHWSRYMGDRQFGWAGTRPTCDLLIKLDAFTNDYEMNGEKGSPLTLMLRQLQVMTSRYRVGDGTGATYVGPANNSSQDSNQALFASIQRSVQALQANADLRRSLMANPEQAQRFQVLQQLGRELQQKLQPLGGPRADWEKNEFNLGSTMEDNPLQNLRTGLGSWRTMFPRFASDTIVQLFLKHGARVWVLRTSQIGGYDPDIAPIAPTTL